MQARTPRDETLTVNHARIPHAEVAHDCLRREVVYLGEGDHWQVRKEGRSPLERRPSDLGRVAATGPGVADGPAQLEYGLAVEVERVKPPRPTSDLFDRSCASHLPTPSPAQCSAMSVVHAPMVARLQGPVQKATMGSPYSRIRSSTSSAPTDVSTRRAVWTGSVG